MAAPAAVLRILVTANGAKAVASLRAVDAQGRKTGSTLGKLAPVAKGAGLALGVAAAAGAKKAFEEFQQAEKAAAQTNAVLKSTKGVANVTAKEIENLANKLSLKVGIDDEAIQSSENLLLTFTSVRNEVGRGNQIFSRAIPVITDMSVALGKDLNSSTIMVGKALQDPIKGITALRRVGVNFNQQQTDTVKKMAESGHMLEAQKFILRELTKEFQGSAAAQATGTAKLKVALNNLAESAGRVFGPSVERAAASLAKFLNEMQTGTGAGGRFARRLRDVAAVIGAIAGTVIPPAVAALKLLFKWWEFQITVLRKFYSIVLTVIDGFLGGLQAIFQAASHLPGIGGKFGKIADAIGDARGKVRTLRDALDNLNGSKVTVSVQVNALLSEFEAGKVPKLIKGKIPAPKRAMGGLVVGGSGSGDKVPLQAMVEPGEQLFVLNRNASAALDFLQGVNAAVPRFAAGGRLSLQHPGSQIRRAAVEMAKGRSAQWLKAHPPAKPVGASGGRAAGSAQMRRWAAAGLRAAGVPATAGNISTIVGRMIQESGGNPKAINLWDSNAAAGHPSQGLMQTIPSTFSAYHVKGTSFDITDPVANVAAAVRYMLARYGHLVGSGPGGYRRGGLVGRFKKGTKKPLKVLNNPKVTGGHPQKVTGGKGKKVAKKVKDRFPEIQNILDYIDLRVQAGEITQVAGDDAKRRVIGDALAHVAKYGLSETERLQLKGIGVGIGGGDTGGSALEDNTAALEQANQLLQQQNDLLAQQKAQADRFYQVSQSQYGVLAQAIAFVANGQIGGKVGLGFALPSAPGKVSSL